MKNPFKEYREKRLRLRQERLDKENKKQLEEARVIISREHYDSLEETQIEQAIHILGQSDDVVSLEALLSLLTSEYTDVNRNKLAEQALLSRNSQLRKRGLKRLLASGDTNERMIVADILYQLGETNWKDIIRGNDMDFIKLLETNDPDFIEPLATVACYHESPLHKRLLETEKGKYFMIKALYNDLLSSNKDIRLNAVEMLAKLGEPQWKEIVRGDDFDDRRILNTGNHVFARILPHIIRNHGNLEVDLQLVAGLQNYYKEPEIISILIELLKHKSYKVRRFVADILVRIAKTDFSMVGKEWKHASKLIKTQRKQKKTKPYNHADGISSSDCRGHFDNSDHLDTGIGLEIPIELQVSFHKKTIVVNPVKQFKLKRLIGILNNRQELTGRPVDIDEKYKAILKLRKLGNAQAIEPLIDTLEGKVEMLMDENKTVYFDYDLKSLAASVLGDLADLSAVEPLSRALSEDNHETVRYEAAVALGELEFAQATESLILALSDWDEGVRMAARNALVKLGESQWGDVIFGDEFDFDRLVGMDNREAIESLLHALKDSTRSDRKSLIEALVHIITDPTGIVRKQLNRYVVIALDNLPVHEREYVVNELIRNLDNPSGFVREQAAKSLIHFVKQDFSLVRSRWKKIADQIIEPHADRTDIMTVRKYSEIHMQHYTEKEQIHTDTGIGLKIPLELSSKT